MNARPLHVLVAGVALAAAACGGAGAPVEERRGVLVYAEDDRVEVFEYQPDDALKQAAASSLVALGFRRDVGATTSAAEKLGLCPGERFGAQPAFAFCSGVAVAPHLVLTAEHCLQTGPLNELTAISGFYYAAADQLAPLEEHAVTEVVARNPWRDYALVRVAGSALVPVTDIQEAAPLSGERVASVAHGMGVAAKIDPAGHAYPVVDDERVFVTDLDAFGGASGGPVFAASGALLGVLTSGSSDYEPTDAGCATTRHVPGGEGAANELVLRAKPTLDEVCARQAVPELCAQAAPSAGAGCAIASPGASDGPLALLLVLLFLRLWAQQGSNLRPTD